MECSICLESLQIPESQLRCGHAFHTKCLEPWFTRKGSCPNCRFQEYPDPEDELDEEWIALYERLQSHLLSTAAWASLRIPTPSLPPLPPSPTSYQQDCEIADTQVSNITETDTMYHCTIAGESYSAEKRDIDILLNQTEESIARCLYFFRQNEGDIVNTILEMCPS